MANLARWTQIFDEVGLAGDPVVHADLRRAYSAPGRAFNTLHHVSECLDLLRLVSNLAHCPQELELAIWFHRAVFDVRRSDNEVRSAELARKALAAAGADAERIERVSAMILALAPDAEPQSEDERLMVDIDRAVLGMRPGRYDEYERQLRRERRHLPNSVYRNVRKKEINDWLLRPQIYLTEWFRARYELSARSNLQRGLRRVSGRGGMAAVG